MGKSDLTKKIEHELIKTLSDKGMAESFVGNEVAINHKAMNYTKNVDILEYDRKNDEFICYEIKITKADFKSENGHNFVGNKNYYVIPSDLLDFTKDKLKNQTKVGIITFNQQENRSYCYFETKKRCKKTQYSMDFGLRSILMYNLMKALHRDIKKYKRLDAEGQVNNTYWHKSNVGRKEFRRFYKGEYLTRQEINEMRNN